MLKNRPLLPGLMQDRATLTARCDLPVPPINTIVALLIEKVTRYEIAHQRLVHGRIFEGELVDLFGQRKAGDRCDDDRIVSGFHPIARTRTAPVSVPSLGLLRLL